MDTMTVKPAAAAAVEPLTAWLQALAADGRPRVLLGASGHLDLSPEEEEHVARQLEESALPALAAAASDAEILVVTGLAPGADLLFAEVACAWLARAGRPYQRVGLLPDFVLHRAQRQPLFKLAGLEDVVRFVEVHYRGMGFVPQAHGGLHVVDVGHGRLLGQDDKATPAQVAYPGTAGAARAQGPAAER